MRCQQSISICVFIFTTVATIIAVDAGNATAQDQFPYYATIQADSAFTRSGPAKVHYMTCRLKRGDRVQVFRHDPDGWLAIRPTNDDFSLVRAKYVLANFSKGTGKITREGVRSWVGTESTDQNEPMWQIQFRKGDLVSLKGKQQIEDTNGELNSWYEVAPPSGEFRWIHQSAIQKKVANQTPIGSGIETPASRSSQAVVDFADQQFTATLTTDDDSTSGEVTSNPESGWSEADSTTTVSNSQGVRGQRPGQSEVASNGAIAPKPFQPEKLNLSSDGTLFPRDDFASSRLQSRDSRANSATDSLPNANGDGKTNQQVGWQVAPHNTTSLEPRVFQTSHSSDSAMSNTSGFSPDETTHNVREKIRNSYSATSPSQATQPFSEEPNRLGEFDSKPAAAFPVRQNEQRSAEVLNVVGTSFNDKVRSIEIALTSEVLKPADQWRLDAYKDAVMKLSAEANLAQEQNQINNLLEKLKSFGELQRRRNALNRIQIDKAPVTKRSESQSPQRNSEGSSRTKQKRLPEVKQVGLIETTSNNLLDKIAQVTPVNTQIEEPVGTGISSKKPSEKKSDSEDDTPIYDAKGWLSRLYTNNGNGQPGYVVQDSSGNILSTILPAPGVNLDRYLDQEVGIIGRRGFNQKYNKPHVTANRVIRLERHR